MEVVGGMWHRDMSIEVAGGIWRIDTSRGSSMSIYARTLGMDTPGERVERR